MSRTYFHIQSAAPHTDRFRSFDERGTYAVGKELNPYLSRLKISATRPHPSLPPNALAMSYIFMLRESVFENVRRESFPHLPSRYTCLWMCEDMEAARKWNDRLPHKGNRRILEIRPLEAVTHTAFEDHITDNAENIKELEDRAALYWAGAKGQKLREVLYSGRFEVLRAIPV